MENIYWHNNGVIVKNERNRGCSIVQPIKYVKPILSGNYQKTSTAKYTLNCEDLDMKIELYSDPESPVPTPMIMFTHGDRFVELYDKLFNKGTI